MARLKLALIWLCCWGLLAGIAPVRAVTVISKTDLALDTSVIVQTATSTRPDNVVVGVVNGPANIDPQDWYKGLFYYLSSDRFNFKDIPAHYVVAPDGKVYEGIQGGEETRVLVTGKTGAPVVIFYLAQSETSDFSKAGGESLRALLKEVTDANAISPEKIALNKLRLVLNSQEKQVNLEAAELFGSWQVTYQKWKPELLANYQPRSLTPKLKLVSATLAQATLTPGALTNVSIVVRNEGTRSVFSDTEGELMFGTQSRAASAFAVNGEWLTGAMAPAVGTVPLRAGEEQTYVIPVRAPLRFGSVSEKFVLSGANGEVVAGTETTIVVQVERGNVQLLEITKLDAATLNVRANPNTTAEVVTRVSAGQRFVWTERNNTGWYKVTLDDGRAAWVLGRYVRVL